MQEAPLSGRIMISGDSDIAVTMRSRVMDDLLAQVSRTISTPLRYLPLIVTGNDGVEVVDFVRKVSNQRGTPELVVVGSRNTTFLKSGGQPIAREHAFLVLRPETIGRHMWSELSVTDRRRKFVIATFSSIPDFRNAARQMPGDVAERFNGTRAILWPNLENRGEDRVGIIARLIAAMSYSTGTASLCLPTLSTDATDMLVKQKFDHIAELRRLMEQGYRHAIHRSRGTRIGATLEITREDLIAGMSPAVAARRTNHAGVTSAA